MAVKAHDRVSKLIRFDSREQFRTVKRAAKIVGLNMQAFILRTMENHAVRVIKAEEKG
jgi:uncharacterized protein (DUF1778 family)